MKCKFHPEALAEFESASDYYHQISENLEARFIDEFRQIEGNLENHSHYGHPADSCRRRLNFKKFPYHLIYEIFPDHLGIFAIRHNHQDTQDYDDRSW